MLDPISSSGRGSPATAPGLLDVRRIRRGIARRAERLLGALHLVEPRPAPAPAAPPVPQAAAVAPPPEPPAPAPAPVEEAVAASPTVEPSSEEPALDEALVQEILDDMVRPALQADGGDISLVKISGGDVYVELVGACSSCPSAVLTMKMGIERLFEEELPGFRQLIQVGPELA